MDASSSALRNLSDSLASAVETAGKSTVTVYGRRRLPATGFAWDGNGLILTASHVVEKENDLTVGLPDGTKVSATFVGRDPGSDIALLKIEGGVPALEKAAEPVRPGHLVLAIGRPDEEGVQASFGGVSVVGGAWKSDSGQTVEGYIRADVAMLPGFSGGPLVDVDGRAVGMVSSHLGRGGGMALPITALESIAATLQQHGKVRRGYLGLGAQSVAVPAPLAQAAGTNQEHGLIVVMIEENGPAATGGLLIGDVLLAVEGTPLTSVEELQGQLGGERVGSEVALSLLRGGQHHELRITVGERA